MFFLIAKEDARRSLKLHTALILVVAAVQIISGLFSSPKLIINGAVIGICAVAMRYQYSRVAGVILISVFTVNLTISALNFMGYDLGPAENIGVAFCLYAITLRALEATIILNRELRHKRTEDGDFITKNRYKNVRF